jgi:hypothetical protein
LSVRAYWFVGRAVASILRPVAPPVVSAMILIFFGACYTE